MVSIRAVLLSRLYYTTLFAPQRKTPANLRGI
jgi:hypothetical protein